MCCDEGQAIVFVGVQERGATVTRFHAAPQGSVRLADDISRDGREFSTAFTAAIQRGTGWHNDERGPVIDAALRSRTR